MDKRFDMATDLPCCVFGALYLMLIHKIKKQKVQIWTILAV